MLYEPFFFKGCTIGSLKVYAAAWAATKRSIKVSAAARVATKRSIKVSAVARLPRNVL